MRLAWPPPWHLIASVLISVIALALVNMSQPPLHDYLSLLALIFVLLIPGYLVTLSLFPGKSDLSGQRRAFLCLAASVFLSGLFSLILAATPRGLQSASLATILSFLAIFLAAVAYSRWSDLPRKRRFLLLPKKGMRSARALPRIFGAGITGKRAALAIVLLATCFIAALTFAFGLYQFPFAEPVTKPGVTGQDENWQNQSGVMLTGQATISPYKNQSINNSSQSGSLSQTTNYTGINSTENSSPVILEDKSKVTVLRTGGGEMGGGSFASSTQPAVEEPASQRATQIEKTGSTLPTSASIAASKVQSKTSVAGKNVSILSIPSNGENQTGKDNLTSAANESQTSSVQASVAPGTGPSPDTNISPIENVNANAGSSGKISAKTASPRISPSNESNLSSAIDKSESNHPPALKALVPDRASPQLPGTAIFWKAEASDEEGDKILYRFLLDGREVRKWSRINSWLSAGLPEGDYQITVLAIDSKHASGDSFDSSMTASFTLSHPNQPPVLQQLKSDRPSPQGRGSMITWTANASDPDNDNISYKFMKNGEDVTGWSSSNSWVWDTSSEKPGDYRIAVQAKDGLHALKDSFDSSLDSTFALTLPNSIPKVTDLKADRSSPQAKGSVITWTVIASDPDGDEILYKFLANDREVGRWSSTNSWVWDTSFAIPGEYRIKVLARDGKHAFEDSFDSSQDAAFTILATNEPPVLKTLVSDIASPEAQGTTVIWKAQAQDPESDKILYKFQLNGRDMSRWSESASWKWSTKDLAAGVYKIRVLARDGKHASENSFDSSMDAPFTLISKIDQQIDQLMKKRSSEASQQENYQSSDIQVTSANGSRSNTILGKTGGTAGQEGTVTPRKLGG